MKLGSVSIRRADGSYAVSSGAPAPARHGSCADELVIEAIVGMARGLGTRTIAAFVGDDDTLAMLSALGVDLPQGYLVGRPFSVALPAPA